jgi:hypothetical protein
MRLRAIKRDFFRAARTKDVSGQKMRPTAGSPRSDRRQGSSPPRGAPLVPRTASLTASSLRLRSFSGELALPLSNARGSVKSSMKARRETRRHGGGGGGVWIYRFGAEIDLDWGSEFESLPDQSRPRGRRSGRIPALPYAPPRPRLILAQVGVRGPQPARESCSICPARW